MPFRWWIVRIFGVAAIVLGLAWAARADGEVGHVDPPELTPAVSFSSATLPSAQTPPVSAELSPPSKTAPPVAAETAPLPSSRPPIEPTATIHVSVPPAAPAPPTEHLIRIQVTTAPAAATAPPVAAELTSNPTAVMAEVRHPGPVRMAIGTFGEKLALLKRDRLVMPAASKTTPVVVQVVQTPAPAPVAAEVRASPQSVIGSFFRR